MARIDHGFDVWWMRIQRHKKRGAAKRYVCTYRTRAMASMKAKVKAKTTRGTTKAVARHPHPPTRPGASKVSQGPRHGSSANTSSGLGVASSLELVAGQTP